MTQRAKWQRVGLALLDALMVALALFAAFRTVKLALEIKQSLLC
jgi:hypothetical protein